MNYQYSSRKSKGPKSGLVSSLAAAQAFTPKIENLSYKTQLSWRFPASSPYFSYPVRVLFRRCKAQVPRHLTGGKWSRWKDQNGITFRLTFPPQPWWKIAR